MASNKEKEHSSSARALAILHSIIEYPNHYTKADFVRHHNMSEDSIKRDIEAMRTARFDVVQDKKHRYALAMDRKFDKLREMLVFTPKEEALIIEGLQTLNHDKTTAERLMRKMSRIYDVSKMHNVFNKSFLTKLDRLEEAKTDKKVVILKDYHSTNSSTVTDRQVEVFKISPEDDIIHAFDLEKMKVLHFRISRVSKLTITDIAWSYETRHYEQTTDPFRIHDNEQTHIHIRMDVGGYNALLEAYPVARGYLNSAPDAPNQYDLVCKVNHRFYGLSNFIMGNYRSIVSIYEPESLIDYVRSESEALIQKKF
jgi:predicted DNA-binding transcriptional regulator YafY